MKRTLKFRLYRKHDKTGKIEISIHEIKFPDNKIIDFMRARFEDYSIIGFSQFTGNYDKYGDDIYEDSICQIHYYHDKRLPSPIGVVEWIDSGFAIRAIKNTDNTSLTGIYSLRFKSGGDFGDTNAVEVIGNIYENPELLK